MSEARNSRASASPARQEAKPRPEAGECVEFDGEDASLLPYVEVEQLERTTEIS